MVTRFTGTYIDRDFYLSAGTVDQINDYIIQGVPPGDFLRAILANDLANAVAMADENNLHNLPAFVSYLYKHAPADCWGSYAKVGAWLELRRHSGGLQ